MTTIEKLNLMLEAPGSTTIRAYRTWLEEILAEQEKYKWHDLRKNPEDLPPAEKEVDVVCEHRSSSLKYNRIIRTHGFYEDGTISEEDSVWRWEDLDYEKWDEENDCPIIPEEWFEYKHYLPDAGYNGVIDDFIIAWREIDPFEEEE